MSRIDLVSKNLLTNCFRNFSEKRFKENCYQKNREEIANVTKMAKVRRIFLGMWKDWVTNTVCCPVSGHFSFCNNFPLLIARVLKFGLEKIYLVLNMTKDSLTFLPLVPSRNKYFCRAPELPRIRTAGPVSGHNNNNVNGIVHKFRQASDLEASLGLAK